MILARQLNVPGAGNAAGEEATGADVYGPRPAAHSPRSRRGRYLNGSFTTTLTPEMTPVAALRTCSTASWLISPAPLRAPVAAADAASSAPRPTCLAPAMAPSTAFRATSPTSPPTSAVLLTRTRALVLTVSTASTPTSLVPLRTPMTPPLAVAPRSPPTWAGASAALSASRRLDRRPGVGPRRGSIATNGLLDGSRLVRRAALRLEPRVDRLEKRILQQPADHLPAADPWTIHSTRDRDHRRDLSARAVSQDLRGDSDHALVEPTAKSLLGGPRSVVADLDAAE